MMKKKRIGAILLSIALVVTQLPAVAMAENSAPEDGSIASFAALDSDMAKQTVPVGTAYDDLVLPDTVTAKVYHITEDTVIPDKDDAEEENSDTSTASPSDADESVSGNGAGQETDSGKTVTTVTTSEEEIPVTWDSEPAYDGDVAGKYVFTADADGYTLSSGAKLPRITVSVAAEAAETTEETQPQEPAPCTKTEDCTLADGHDGECVTEPPLADNGLAKQMVSWTFVDSGNLNAGELPLPGVNADNQADFDTVVSMLPKQINGTVDGEADPVTVDITGWSCPEYKQDGDDHWPLTGEYIFTADLEAGYACDPAPTVKVTLGGADNLADFGGLTITGGATTQEMDGQIKLGSGNYTISGTWSGTLTGVDYDHLKAVITVPSGVTANITLDGAVIDVSATANACAFAVDANGTANITLSGTNTLTSGKNRAGLEAPEHATVTIGGSDADSLTATGGGGIGGAGIGGGREASGGTIKITGGTVTANGGRSSAGVGGVGSGSGGSIEITGGTVVANGGVGSGSGSGGGSGVGGGNGGNGGAIKITGGTVIATGSDSGSGIGGGCGGGSGDITIGGNAHVTAVGGNGGSDTVATSDSNGTITIGGNAVVIANSGNSGGIGNHSSGIGGGGYGYGGGGAGIGGGCGVMDNFHVSITGGTVTATGGIGIGGGSGGSGGTIEITGGTVAATGSSDSGIGGGYSYGGAGAAVTISGQSTNVTATGNQYVYDVGGGQSSSNSGSLSVTDGATLEMKGNGTNAADPQYKGCTIIEKDGIPTHYDEFGAKIAETPKITVQPQGQTLDMGNPVTLSVTAGVTDRGTLSYQWYSNTENKTTGGTAVGENLATYSPPTNAAGTVYYYVTVTNTNHATTAAVTSDVAAVTVKGLTNAETPVITQQPQGGTYSQNASAALTVTACANDGGTLSYQWYSNTANSNTGGSVITGAASANYAVPTGATGTTYYYVVITNTNHSATGQKTATVTSNAAAVTVNMLTNAETPVITQQPQGGTYSQNASAALTVTARANDGGTLSYQWYSNTANSNTGGAVITGATSASYAVPTGVTGTTYYYVVVTNTNYSATGQTTATVTSNVAAVIVTDNSNGGNGGGGGGGTYTPPAPKDSYTVTGDNISQSISRSELKKLADDRRSLTLRCDKASMTFDPAALKAILAAVPSTAGNITFAAAPADLSAFTDAAKQIGAHPVYDFTIRYEDGKGNTVTVPVSFPAGSAAITLTYPRTAAETEGSLFMVYVDGKGAVTWLDKSSYDNGRVLAEVSHFSTYGVAYKAPAPVFTDIADHWAKSYIEFVAARGLLSGTGDNLFSPDATMTRGMFVTALGRLAGVNPDSYKTRSFTDVKADAYYAAYVEWAAQKNIAGGTGDKLFSPDSPITREQMAVIMTNYAGQMGYAIPTPLAEAAFADSDKISEWAAKEVAAMQRAGIVKGRDGNRFDPQASATRAEVSVVLRRFVEVVIDPATATGWVKNDSGHWLYYKGGKALTGWQTIGKLRYFFNADGVMHEGWKQDEATGKWYYWTNAGAATGWREIDGKWYYFDENGVMAVNTKVDGYEVGPDGARK